MDFFDWLIVLFSFAIALYLVFGDSDSRLATTHVTAR